MSSQRSVESPRSVESHMSVDQIMALLSGGRRRVSVGDGGVGSSTRVVEQGGPSRIDVMNVDKIPEVVVVADKERLPEFLEGRPKSGPQSEAWKEYAERNDPTNMRVYDTERVELTLDIRSILPCSEYGYRLKPTPYSFVPNPSLSTKKYPFFCGGGWVPETNVMVWENGCKIVNPNRVRHCSVEASYGENQLEVIRYGLNEFKRRRSERRKEEKRLAENRDEAEQVMNNRRKEILLELEKAWFIKYVDNEQDEDVTPNCYCLVPARIGTVADNQKKEFICGRERVSIVR